jgi:hypothetical protein
LKMVFGKFAKAKEDEGSPETNEKIWKKMRN